MKTSDHIIAIIKAGLTATSPIGGFLASLIGDYIPMSTQKSIETSIEYLKEKLKKLENRIDFNTIDKDEFAEIFKSAYFIIVRTHQNKKLNAATSLISNILLKHDDHEKLTYTELDHFSRSLDTLSIGAINILAIIVKIARDKNYNGDHDSYNLTFRVIRENADEYEPHLIMGLLGELNTFNLIHIPGIPTVRLENYDNYAIQLTPLGFRFAIRLLIID